MAMQVEEALIGADVSKAEIVVCTAGGLVRPLERGAPHSATPPRPPMRSGLRLSD